MKWKKKYAKILKNIAEQYGFECSDDYDYYNSIEVSTPEGFQIAAVSWYDDTKNVYYVYACQALMLASKKTNDFVKYWEPTDKFVQTDCWYFQLKSKYRTIYEKDIKDNSEQEFIQILKSLDNDFKLMITAQKRHLTKQRIENLNKDFV